jgi:hypothetical protein
MVGLDILGKSLNTLGRVGQFQAQGEGYTLITACSRSNKSKQKHRKGCLRHPLALCRRWFWLFLPSYVLYPDYDIQLRGTFLGAPFTL